MRHTLSTALAAAALLTLGAAADKSNKPDKPDTKHGRKLDELTNAERLEVLKRAQVWMDVPTATLDIAKGPGDVTGYAPGATVTCDHVEPGKPLVGHTPKFECAVGPDDVVRVKHSDEEVLAEVAATRIFWALGFGADRMFPVHVVCRKCPEEPIHGKAWVVKPERTFELAALERRLPGTAIEAKETAGWTWPELDTVDEAQGGAPVAHRDALKLMAVLVQHSDNKREQQRLVCLPDGVRKDPDGNETCTKPFLYVNDIGVSFGKATTLNTSRVDLAAWQAEPIWKDAARCVGNLRKAISGNLEDPVISEAGRAFLAARLALLTDAQIRAAFTIARFGDPELKAKHAGSVDDWVRVFKKKRDEIASAHCPQ